jgi:nucleotide-binding universal stress UspA family protein
VQSIGHVGIEDLELLMMKPRNKMRTLNEILLPTDFSPPAIDVARNAAAVARYFNSGITLLHVLPPINVSFAAFGSTAMIEDVLDHQKEETCESLNRSFADEFQGMDVKRIVAEGDAADTITAYCAAQRVGLVMMPTRGCTAFRRYLLGSVTAKVLHDVNCPVWTSSHLTDRRSLSVIPKVIACAIDLTLEGDLILKWAAGLASDLQARLVAVHAIPSLEFHLEMHLLEANTRRAIIGNAHARISNVLQSSGMPEGEVRVAPGSVAAVVRSAVEDSGADLLIIGRASHPRRMGRLRTHSYALIRESECPVLSI